MPFSKRKFLVLTKELEDFSKEKKNKLTCYMCEGLKVEKDGLSEKVDDQLNFFYKFINGKKDFDMMLDKQRGMFDKGVIS